MNQEEQEEKVDNNIKLEKEEEITINIKNTLNDNFLHLFVNIDEFMQKMDQNNGNS